MLGDPAGWTVAEEQARVAHTYGSVIDHPSLCTWAQALLSNMHLWVGRSKRAVLVASKALETSPAGTARARLYSVRARALALLVPELRLLQTSALLPMNSTVPASTN